MLNVHEKKGKSIKLIFEIKNIFKHKVFYNYLGKKNFKLFINHHHKLNVINA